MTAELNDLLARARQEWQANRRLQLGVFLIGLILLLGMHQALDSWRQQRLQAATTAAQSLHELHLAAAEQQWPERARQAAAAHESIQRQLWQATSEGAAQAAVRDVIQAQAKRHGVVIERINMRSLPPAQGARHAAVRVELQGAYEVLAWQRFIAALEARQPALLIEADRIDRGLAQRPRYRLNITAWYLLDGTESEP